MLSSRLLLWTLVTLFCTDDIHSSALQNVKLRLKRQSPTDFFDTLYNKARAGGVNILNTVGGLGNGIQRRDSSEGGNPFSFLTTAATSLLTPLITAGVSAGLDGRRFLQRGADTGTVAARNGASFANEGSKTVNNVLRSSLGGIQNITDLGGNFFRSVLPNREESAPNSNPFNNLFTSRASRDAATPQSSAINFLNSLFAVPFQFFRSLIPNSSNERRNTMQGVPRIDMLRSLFFRPRNTKPSGNAIEQNLENLAESVDASGRTISENTLTGRGVEKIPRLR